MVIRSGLMLFVLWIGLWPAPGFSGELADLFAQVEQLKLERNGYVLGRPLGMDQLALARAHPMESSFPGTFKFRDRNLYIVAQENTLRVLIIYESFDHLSRENAQHLIGDLFFTFNEPTIMAHDRVIYWAYGKQGKISRTQFQAAQKGEKTLGIIATVKCISETGIMDGKESFSEASAYYIISSEPVLKYFLDKRG